jgi:broad specificity phosphatase PhoE
VTPGRIHLVRHGQTASNAARVFQHPDTPLSERGEREAARVAARLAGCGIALVLASDFARARATAERVAAASGAPLELEPLLQERNFGALRGRPYADLGVDAFAADYAPPGGETWDRFAERVDRAWERVLEAAGRARGQLAVVTHGLVCHSLAVRHFSLPAGADPRRGFANTSLTLIEAAPPHAVSLLACVAHLEGIDGPGGGPEEDLLPS